MRRERLREEEIERERRQQELEWEAELAALKADWECLKREILGLKANFDPNQPRVPAGSGRESGRWAGPGIGHNQGPPLDKPPAIPRKAPATAKERNAVAKQVAKWLARGAVVVASRTPVGSAAVATAAGAVWLYNQYNAHIEAYRDPPKSLEELQQAASSPRSGYDRHHVAERTSAAEDGFSRAQIEDPNNIVLISRFKHWEITAWYNTRAVRFGGLSPRDYLRGKSWEERQKIGLEALRTFGVLKP